MILRAEGIRKRFETRWVLRGADLSLDAGEVVLLTGRNGSGKTTFASILATLLHPDGGTVLVDEREAGARRRDVRRTIGFVSHRPLLYLGLTPLENLTLFGRLAGRTDAAERARDLLERLQMTPFAGTPLERFSRGMLQRVVLARAFLGSPRLLILDEPYAGLDDDGTVALNALIRDAQLGGAATLVISHDRERLGSIRTRHARIDEGRIAP